MNPFAVFGIAARFDVNMKELEKTHRDLSRAVHPDRALSAGRVNAAQRAVEVNEAFRVIKDPVRRAEALFAIHGVPVGETNEPKPSPDFLMTVLEEREALGEAKAAKNLASVQALAASVRERDANARAALTRMFAPPDAQDAQDEKSVTTGREKGAIAGAVGLLGELRFYRRFLEEVSAIEDDLAGLDEARS